MAKIKQSKLNSIAYYDEYKASRAKKDEEEEREAEKSASASNSNSQKETGKARIKQSKLNNISGYSEYKAKTDSTSTTTSNASNRTSYTNYYSRPENLWSDAERMKGAVTSAESSFVRKRNEVERAAKELEQLENAVKRNPRDEAAYKKYERAYNSYKVLLSQYELINSTYNEAVNAYNSYVTDQQGQYDSWRSSVRDSADVEQALAELDERLKALKQSTNVYAVASNYDDRNRAKAEEYAAEMESLTKQRELLLEEKEWADHLYYSEKMDGGDFEKYSALGAAAENPEVDDTLLTKIFGWAPETKDAENIVTYARENADKVKKVGGWDSGLYGYMTEEEVDIYNYLLAKEGEESAQEYLNHLEEYLNSRKGGDLGEAVRGIDNGILRTGATGLYGLAAGVDQFVSGTKQFFTGDELPTSAIQYGSQYIQEDLADSGPKIAGSSIGQHLYGATTTIGNMAPSILAAAATGGLGASAGVAQTVGAATLGVSAAGNAYKEKLAEGYDEGQARTYSTLVGASEAALQRVLGGIGALGGMTDDILLAKVNAIDKAWARVALTGAVKLGSEITEEELQLWLEPLFASWVLNEQYDAPTVQEMAETAIVTALSTGVLESGGIISAGGKHTSKIGNTLNTAGTEGVQAIIEEGLATNPSSTSYALAQQLQKKLERGETVTDQELGNLYRANVENVNSQFDPDAALAEAAAEAVARENGETSVNASQSVQERSLAEGEETLAQNARTAQASSSEALGMDTAVNVPYNVMSMSNPTRQAVALTRKQAATNAIKSANYGENGTNAFMSAVASTTEDPFTVRKRFDAAYQAGLTGLLMKMANLVDDFQVNAYNAGRKDLAIGKAADKKHKSGAIFTEDASGLDATNVPKDVAQAKVDFANWFAKRMGVQAGFNTEDGLPYNAFYEAETGGVDFAQDFGISPKLMQKLGSMDFQQKVEKLADQRGHSFVFYVGHEIAGHVTMDRAPKQMRAFINAMYNYKQRMAGDENLARDKQTIYGLGKVKLDTAEAVEEVSSDSILDLYDSEQEFMDAMYRVYNGVNEDAKQGARKYLEILKDTIAKLKAWISRLTGNENAQARANAEQGISELERLRDMFEKAVAASMKEVERARRKGEAVGQIKDGLGDDATVQTDKNGDLLVAQSKDKSKVVFSYKTFEDGGREKLRAALQRNGHTKAEINDTLALIEDAADYLKILAAGFAKSHNYTVLHDHLIADITTNLKTGKQVMSALVNNGDYPVNIDLALICKKRVAYMTLMTRLIEDGIFDLVNYNGEAIADVNEILRANNFETACLGCFVESRRLQFQAWAETIVSEWNDEVGKRKKNPKAFGFAQGYATLTDAEMDALQTELKNAGKKNKQGNLNLGKGSVKAKMGRLLDKVPSLQQTLTTGDLLTPNGLAALRAYDANLFSIVKSRYGAASPKIVQDFNPYASELAMLTFKSVSDITSNAVKGAQAYIKQAEKDAGGKPVKKSTETSAEFKKRKAEWTAKVEDNAMRKYLYDIGGARIQSFSDFMIENVFDYLQIVADLAANEFPLHGYTKEIICLRLLGMTGAKWNGSLIAHTERSMGKEYAGLIPASAAKDGGAILVHTEDGDFAIGFDDYARNKATDGESFIQSIGFKDIVALQLDPRYSAHVGSITIGVSDKQILAMLDSPLFSMVIPYHASGMLPGFAQRVGVDMYNDYTDYQNTTVKQLFDAAGQRVDELYDSKGKKIKIDTSFAFNAEVQKTGDARQAANNYLNWCGQRHPVYDGRKIVGYATFSPKFSDSPYGTDFSRHPNYYKLLEDFSTYDSITGASAVQGAVTMTFPSESNRLSASEMEAYKQRLRETGIFSEKEIAKYETIANKTFKELIADEVKGRAEYNVAQDAKWEKTYSEIKGKLRNDHARPGAKFSMRDGNYTTRQIDWALDNGVISAQNKADLIRAIDNEIHRGYSIPKDLNGNYIVESGNVMMFTNGDRHNPSLDMVVVLDDQFETLMADAKEEIYRGAKSGNVHGAAEIIEGLYYSGYATIHSAETYRANENNGRGRKRSVRQILADETGAGRNYSLRDQDYLAAVESGDMETAQRMVDEKAAEVGAIMQENGRKPLDLYRGSPSFGNTVFRGSVIFATTHPSVAAGYGKTGYAKQRRISESYTPDDGTAETLIKNAKNVLDWNLKPFDEAMRNDIKEKIRADSAEQSEKANEVWTGEAVDVLQLDEDMDNALAWVLTLPGSINENLDDFGDYVTTDDLERWLDNFDRNLPKVKEYFNEHRNELKDTAAWPMFKYVMGYDLSDFAIEARYKYLQSFNDDLLVTETGNLVPMDTVRRQVEEGKDIGTYHLYGFAGDNPLVIDGKGGVWHSVPVEQWGGYFTTDGIAKRAQEEGYTSVCIKNINDVAMNNYSANINSDIYMFFNRDQVKSADPVTYDDNGNVIPLSKRFDSSNEDIRYSMKDSNIDIDSMFDSFTEKDWDAFLGTEWISNLGYTIETDGKPRYKGDTTTKGKIAKLTDGRIDRLLREYGSSNPQYAQAYITAIHPRDFLSLTLSDEFLQKWDAAAADGTNTELFPLDIDKLRTETQMPYLNIDSETGKVIGHEGRHRMRALLEAGITEVPIAVCDAETKYSKQKERSMRLTSQAYGDGAVNNGFATTVRNLIPINAVNKADIVEAYGGEGDISFSLKGEEDMRAEIKRIRNEGKSAGKSDTEIDQEIADAVNREYGKLLKEYGEIKRGEKPAREIKVPSRTGEKRKVSQTVRTILEAQVTPEASIPTIKEMVTQGEFSYDVYTDEAAIENAVDIIRDKTYGVALAEWIRDVESGKVSKTSTALGWALYNEAATAKDTETAMTILNYMVGHQRSAAQAVQATRILKKLSPDAQLYSAVRSVQKLEEDLNKGRRIDEESARRAARSVGQAKKDAADSAAKALKGAKVKRTGNRVTIDSNQAGEPFVFEYAQKVGETVAKGLEAKRNSTAKERTFLQQIAAQIKRFAVEKMPKDQKGKQMTAIDLLRDYVQNQAFYADAWQYAQEEIREKYAGDPVFDEFVNTGIGVDSNFNPRNAIFMRALVKAAADSGEGKAVLRKQAALGFTGMADTIADNLIRQTGASGEMADTIRDAAYAYVYNALNEEGKPDTATVDAAIRSAMSDIGVKVSEAVLSGTGESAKQAIISKLVGKYGFGVAEATNTADIVADRFDQMCRSFSQRRLESMFKERKVDPKTIPEKIEMLARLGAFDADSAYNQRAAERIFKEGTTITINEDLARQFLQATTQDARDNILAEIYRDVGRQIPSRFVDKWNAWRYLAMLGNPRTHVRNVVGNLGFAPVVIAKDATATLIESAVSFVTKGNISRTKAMPGLKLLKAAWNDYVNVANEITAGGKYNDAAIKNQHVEEGRVIFGRTEQAKTGIGKFVSATAGKATEKARKGNSAAMEKEDVWFARPHYAFALAQYCKAHGVSVENLRNGKALGNGRAYAIKEAQKATYRDTNAFSQAISELGRYHGDNMVKKGISLVAEGILPFRKTPANILVRGVEYSPVGLLRSLTVDLVKVKRGEITAAEAIDNISAGLTGTGLLALGVWLAAEGLIRGAGGDDEEEKEFEELQGHQAYALELPDGTSVTLDWLAPEVLPLFIGVNIYEMASENKGKSNLSDILTAVSNVTEPLLEMSCLQSLNDVFDSVGYAASGGLDALPSALMSAATSYLTQAFPTILGQAERSMQDTRMTTYTEKDGFLTSDMQYTLGKISARLPGWDFQQIPYVDAWGRTESTGTKGENAANNFLNPAYMSQIETSEMEAELQRLYDSTGETSVLPSRAGKYFTVDGERKDLTADEYVIYATEKGQLSYDMLTDLTSRSRYDDMSDAEKAEAVEMALEYAAAVAKTTVSDYELDGWIETAHEVSENTGMDEIDYILYKMALSMEDEKHISGTVGSIDNIEKAAAILGMPNLSNGDITALWDTEKGYEAYAAGVDMRAYVEYVGAGGTVNMDKLIDAQTSGIGTAKYLDFLDMLDKYDKPTDSGKYGTFTQDEAEAAIAAMSGLTRAQKAYLWQSVNSGWKSKNNPWR